MLDRLEDGVVDLICDDCGEYVEFSSFEKAVKFKKKQKGVVGGWRTSFHDGEFRDHCPSCVRKFSGGR
jgi:Fe2+ or Zn2+ uptake regulation protein